MIKILKKDVSDRNPAKSLSYLMTSTALLLIFSMSSPVLAFQTVCGPEVRLEVAELLNSMVDASVSDQLVVQAELYQNYSNCLEDAELVPTTDGFFDAAKQCGASVPSMGSIYYEEMPCCGYDPQRRQFGCPVKIKQSVGYGPAPLPGSREYVFHCVADDSGNLVPVGVDSVHLADEMHGRPPTWQFAVIANVNKNLHTIYPMNGDTRQARSILSWALQPTSCNYTPIWGNVIDYRIRRDQ
jgi:hypothetical protein